jgi:hypothetical protein
VKVSFALVWRNETGQPQLVLPQSPKGQGVVHTVEQLSRPLGAKFKVVGEEVVVWRNS